MMGHQKTKWSVAFLLTLFLFVQAGILFPRPARAFTVSVVSDVPAQTESVLEQIRQGITGALFSAAIQGVTYFTKKIAYDAATYIASGGKGQGAQVYDKGFGDYITGVLADTAGDAIGELGKPFGLNLCQFPDLDFQIFLQIGLGNLFGQAPQPNCSWQQLKDGWNPEKFAAKYGGDVGKYIGEKFNASLSVKNSDFGISLGAIAKIDALQLAAKEAETAQRLEGSGVKALTDLVSGNIKTPADLIKADLEHLSPQEQAQLSAGQYWDLVVNTDNLIQLAGVAASTFLNTLASQLLQKFLTKGFLPSGTDQYDPSFFGVVTGNRRAAQQAFSLLLTPTIPESGIYDIVGEFAACPPQPGLNNCIVDSKLHAAIERARTQTPLTIREALKEGLLHGGWQIISPRNEVENTSRECFRNNYCYSNIQKLRKARIFPLGFEIAASKADPYNPPTLEEVVDGFESCAPDGRPSPQFPWCHLINPNWVIKAPEILSRKLVGPELVDPSAPQRREEYMDFSTCVLEDANGECLGNYGYCTEEKNVWRLGGDSCEPQFNTCKTYTATEGGQKFSYLSRTLDFGECSANTAGCRLYSAVETAPGLWQASVDADFGRGVKAQGRNEAVYLNGTAIGKTCSADANGCTALYPATLQEDGSYAKDSGAQLLYAQKAPISLGCYDADPRTDSVDWPATVAQINNDIPANPACDEFASVCVESELWCEAYTPTRIASAAPIPGIIGANACDASCVGYDTFRQEASSFEASRFPLYFIPDQGQSCEPAYAGCDEFTNLDSVAAGGEGLEYFTAIKYCEKPLQNGANERVFYSWEGSVVEGFVLRVHRLLPVDSGTSAYIAAIESGGGPLDLQGLTSGEVFPISSPEYDDMGRTAVEEYYARCNDRNYQAGIADPTDPFRADPDCRALYDEDGVVYYRLLAHTVTVSDECHPLRKSVSELYTDTDVKSANICTNNIGGVWENNECRRCYQGGRYQNGSCVYQTISSVDEGSSCPASANGCRAYTGNTGGNVQVVFEHEFEPANNDAAALTAARANWDSSPAAGSPDVRVASEALQVSGHSLYVNVQTVTRNISANTLRANDFYELSFWARSVAVENLSIAFVQDRDGNGIFTDQVGSFTLNLTTSLDAPETIGSTWAQYRLGPAEFIGDTALPTQIFFTRQAIPGRTVSEYFLDSVRLTALQDRAYRVKDSWKTAEGYDVPFVCDATPEDSFPGAALGCTEYKDSANATAYAAGFETLCREKAVGCQPFYDTYNTTSGGEAGRQMIYNLWCSRNSGGTIVGNRCRHTIFLSTDFDTPDCTIPVGGSGCYIEKTVFPDGERGFGQLYGGAFRPSTIVIPADTPETSPLFLAVRNEFLCRERDKGCTKLGLEEKVSPQNVASAYRHTTTYLLNDPDAYAGIGGQQGILCRAEQIGCGEFSAGGTQSYFKDPAVTGAGTCLYRTDVDVDGVSYDGWFLDNTAVGSCSNRDTDGNRIFCATDADCGGGNTCQNIGATACYDTFLRRAEGGLVYDIHSNRDANYAGRVGQCPSEANLCTELVDPADTSELHPNGQPYSVLANEKIIEKIGQCNGRVSLTEGCVLMDQTENPNKLYDSTLTYAVSARAEPRFSLVAPQSAIAQADNDSNIILKVDRDRACGEWLACRASIRERDASGNPRTLCTQYKACNATEPGKACTNWVPEGSSPFARLTESAYARRDTSWYGTEYSGYSLFNVYQITDLSYVRFDFGEYDGLRRDGYEDTQYIGYISAAGNAACESIDPLVNTNWQQCGPGNAGRCYGQRCLVPIGGSVPADPEIPSPVITAARTPAEEENSIRQILGYFTGGSCKVFPEKTSPFPGFQSRGQNSILARADSPFVDRTLIGTNGSISLLRRDVLVKKPLFDNANICQDGNCSCGYTKLIYKGGLTDYWPLSVPATAPASQGQGVCGPGEREGQPCETDTQCGTAAAGATTGICNRLTKRETHIGLSGFCLERDFSRPVNGLANFAGGEQQNYACLTWLPIDVSASNIDFYNTFIAAGYYPSRDALDTDDNGSSLNFGESICTAATRVGGRVNGGAALFAEPMTTISVGRLMDEYFSGGDGVQYFLDDGHPRLSDDDDEDCEDDDEHEDFPYHALACDRTFSEVPGSRYQAMQVWAWKILGQNALVLRVERPDGIYAIDYPARVTSGCTPISGTASCSRLYHLLSSMQALGDGYRTWGTLMHPPRLWGDTTQRTALRGATALRYIQNGGPRDISVVGEGHSPEREISPTNFNDRIVQTTAEAVIRESDIDDVRFIPMAFPGEIDGGHPAFFSAEIVIDFNELNNSRPAGYQTVRSYFEDDEDEIDSEAGVLPDKDEYLDNTGENTDYVFDGHLWTYKQTKQTGAGITSWTTYPNRSPAVNYYTNPATDIGRRNEIESRYVAVYASGNVKRDTTDFTAVALPSFMAALTAETAQPPQSTGQDPFEVSEVRCERGAGNWFAIGMDFNDRGEFLGYISRWCYANDSDPDAEFQNGMLLTVAATLNDQCTEFAEVYDSTNSVGFSNKAWTNRVWDQSMEGDPDNPDALSHPSFLTAAFRRDQANPPFGTLNLFSADIVSTNAQKLRNYAFAYPNFSATEPFADGVPYSCAAVRWVGFDIVDTAAGGNQCGPNTPLATVITNTGFRTVDDGRNALYQLFARSFDVAELTSAVTPSFSVRQGEDRSATLGVNLVPPQVYSLNPARCFGAGAEQGACTAGDVNNITVNERNYTTRDYDGRAPAIDEDANLDGFIDPLIGVGSFAADVQFFVFADDNRMPLRQVLIDWNDGTQLTPRLGLYKNRKPFCEDNDSHERSRGLCGLNSSSLTQMTCMENRDCPVNAPLCFGVPGSPPEAQSSQYVFARFGNLPRACTTDRYGAVYNYTCSTSAIAAYPSPSGQPPWTQPVSAFNTASSPFYNPDAYQRLTGTYGLGGTSRVCAFRPRVQAVDNWGWCTGTNCGGEFSPGGTGCYDPAIGQGECRANASAQSWIPYKGFIIVVPT